MSELEILTLMNAQFTTNGIFLFVGAFLLWVAFRGVLRIQDQGANLIQKILSTLFSLGIVYFNLLQVNFIGQNFGNSAGALCELDSVSSGSQGLIDLIGCDGVSNSLIPYDPIFAVWWLVITIMLMAGIWMKKEDLS
tara:strand:- start:42 stop:452 length:411 start_codon:yes stop_codon:yes gene_type:complete